MRLVEERYAPGRRENSFFMEKPSVGKKRKGRKTSNVSENIFEYSYYVDSDGRLIKEKLK